MATRHASAMFTHQTHQTLRRLANTNSFARGQNYYDR